MSEEKNIIDFSGVEVPTDAQYLAPGMYRLKVDKSSVKVVTPEGKNAYLSVRFVDKNGSGVTEKFFLTDKTKPRIQYLHNAFLGKPIDTPFTSYKQLGDYLAKVLTAKIVARPMVTGGTQAPDGKFYSGLPYLGFIVADESLFTEGAFDKDSPEYKRVVTIQKPNGAVANTDASILPSAEDLDGYKAVDSEDPW